MPLAIGGAVSSDDSSIPDGYELAPPPAASDIPTGYEPAPPAQAQQPYTGRILPFSTDAQGQTHFDPHAGILGSLISAATLPGDVATGQVPTPYSPGPGGTAQPDPALMQRTANLALTMSPPPVATSYALPTVAPSALTLKNTAGAQYDAARAVDLRMNGPAVSDMFDQLKSSLQSDRGIISENAPQTFALINQFNKPPGGSYVGVSALDAARQGFNDIKLGGGTDGLAAGRAVSAIDNFLDNLTPGQLHPTNTADPSVVSQLMSQARGNYAAAQRSNALTGSLSTADTGILDRALGRAESTNSGMNLDNVIRQRVNTFLQNPKNLAGFSPDEIAMLQNVRAGTYTQDMLRWASNFVGGGGGMHAGLGAGAGALLGEYLMPGTAGAIFGATAVPAMGYGMKSWENYLAQRRLLDVDQAVRSRSPLYQQQQQNPTFAPFNPAPVVGPGLLSPQPPLTENQLAGRA